jgi:methylase of polypeptide subunit release factors
VDGVTDDDRVLRLRDAFLAADYTTSGVDALLGPVATRALSRGETVPARRATAGGSPLETLVRLFLLQIIVPEAAAQAALPPEAAQLGLVATHPDGTRAALDVRPYSEANALAPSVGHVEYLDVSPYSEAGADAGAAPPWWVVSDLGTGLDGSERRLPDDHVLGVGGASTMLAQLTPREAVGTTVDVGTGCGVQALHASRHSGRVVATDISSRALRLAQLTAGLSAVDVDFREGSLLGPVDGQQVDLIVSNPPFVVSPAGTHTYRDGGQPLDGICARLVREAAKLLAPQGDLVLLANWVHIAGSDWRDRVGGWLPGHGIDALVVQREVLDPAEYVAMWLRDSGESADLRAYDGWLQGLEEARVEGVGMGFLRLRRTDVAARSLLIEWPHPVEQPLAPHLSSWLDRRAWLTANDDDRLLAATLRVARDVVQEQVGLPGAEDPAHVVLRRLAGMRPAVRVDTATAALVGASEGTLTLAALVAAVASVLGDNLDALQERLLPEVRDLVDQGLLEPV